MLNKQEIIKHSYQSLKNMEMNIPSFINSIIDKGKVEENILEDTLHDIALEIHEDFWEHAKEGVCDCNKLQCWHQYYQIISAASEMPPVYAAHHIALSALNNLMVKEIRCDIENMLIDYNIKPDCNVKQEQLNYLVDNHNNDYQTSYDFLLDILKWAKGHKGCEKCNN